MKASASKGNMGGIEGADELCQSEYGANYKALVVADTGDPETSRIACTSDNCSSGGASEHVNWVLSPNTKYIRPDGTTIGTTTSNAIFESSLDNPISGGGTPPKTGLDYFWVTSSNTCSSWTSTSGTARTGNPMQTSISIAFSDGARDCSETAGLFCVEQ